MEPPNVPHDVRFAQKASALVKAAALDPRLIDLEKFRQMSHIIFCRVYHVIYKEKPVGFVDEPQSQDDFICNAQCVVDALRYRLGDEERGILHEITGQDVCFGSHRAIALLVDLLFAEGQKMWLLKQQGGQEQQQYMLPEIVDNMPSAGINGHNQHHNHYNHNSNNNQYATRPPPRPRSADPTRQLRKAGAPKPFTMRNYFDEILMPQQAPNEDIYYTHSGRGNQEQQAQILFQDGIVMSRPPQFRSDSPSSPKKSSHHNHHRKFIQPTSKKQHDAYPRHLPFDALELNLEEDQIVIEGDINDILQTYDAPETTSKETRRKRPTSAPSHGKVKGVSERLYNIATVHGVVKFSGAAPQKKEKEKDSHGHHNTAAGENDVAKELLLKEVEKVDPPSNNFRYDILTGRKIYLPDNIQTDTEKKNSKVTMGNIRTIDELNQDLNSPRAASRPLSPTARDVAPSWPGQRIGKTATEWIQRQRDFIQENYKHKFEKPFKSGLYRGCGECGYCPMCLTKNNIVKPLNDVIKLYQNARMYKGYKQMERGDVLITVEHCFNCEHHNFSLRHDAKMYEKHGDSALQTLCQQLYNAKVCCRVGLVRLRSCIKKTSQVSDVNSRIGAFEVQIAYCDQEGSIHVELLHSKLAAMRWPSKQSLDRKIQEFICKRCIVSHCSGNPGDSETIENPIANYPLGFVAWDEMEIGRQGKWMYPADAVDQLEECDRDGNCNISFNIYWVFDVRNMVGVNVGDRVRVLNLQNPKQKREYRPLIGTIQDKIFEHDGTIQLTLSMAYTHEVLTMDATNILPNSLYVAPESVKFDSEQLPPALDFLFFLIVTWQTLRGSPTVEFRVFDVMDESSDSGDILLCRQSYFCQCRNIVAAFEELNPTGIFDTLELSDGFVTHPLTNEKVCLQDAYSENVIDWMAFRFPNGSFNVSDLCRRSNIFSVNKLAKVKSNGQLTTTKAQQRVSSVTTPGPSPRAEIAATNTTTATTTADVADIVVHASHLEKKPAATSSAAEEVHYFPPGSILTGQGPLVGSAANLGAEHSSTSARNDSVPHHKTLPHHSSDNVKSICGRFLEIKHMVLSGPLVGKYPHTDIGIKLNLFQLASFVSSESQMNDDSQSLVYLPNWGKVHIPHDIKLKSKDVVISVMKQMIGGSGSDIDDDLELLQLPPIHESQFLNINAVSSDPTKAAGAAADDSFNSSNSFNEFEFKLAGELKGSDAVELIIKGVIYKED